MNNKLHLADMDASDMLDVIHFYFEEDITYESEAVAEARSHTRTRIYSEMYDRVYKYQIKKSTESDIENNPNIDRPQGLYSDDEDDLPIPFSTKKQPVIPYTPATDFDPEADNPFGMLLDAPLN